MAETDTTTDTAVTPSDTIPPEEAEEETETKPAEGEAVEFKPPKTFHAPDASDQVNGEFDLVCSFRVRPDGSLCMTKLGDTPMPGKGKGKMGKKMPETMAEYGAIIAGEMNQNQ